MVECFGFLSFSCTNCGFRVECYRTKKFTLEPLGSADNAGTLIMDGEPLDFKPISVEMVPDKGLFVY